MTLEKEGLNRLMHVVHEVAELLPAQGPIDVFIHHNTLHAFEHLSFEDAVEQASQVYGAQSFLPEQRYLEEYQSGRITDEDLEVVLKKEDLSDGRLWGHSLHSLLRKFFVTAPPVESFQQVKWLLRESVELIKPQELTVETLICWLQVHARGEHLQGLKRINPEAAESLGGVLQEIPLNSSVTEFERTILWSAILQRLAEVWHVPEYPVEKPGEAVCEEMINPLLIRFSEEYLDLGFSQQLMPGRRKGMLAAFLALTERAHFALPQWLEPLRYELDLYRRQDVAPIDLLAELLNDFRIPTDDHRTFLLKEALSLRGWAGYIALVEQKPEVLHGQEGEIRPSLVEFLNVRLILKKYAERSILYHSKVQEAAAPSPELRAINELYCFAFHILVLITSLDLGGAFFADPGGVNRLLEVLLPFSQSRRRRVWHLAYEHNFYTRTLNALALHARESEDTPSNPAAQFVFCIDDREESIRRHLEMRSKKYQTFGTAGFFGVDANYTLMSGTSAPYCPVIIKPTHAIREVPREGLERRLSKYQRKQATWFRLSGYINRSSGSIIHSMLLSLAGAVSLIPMLLGVMAPRGAQALSRLFAGDPMIPHDLNALEVGREEDGEGHMPGYTLEEMAVRVTAVLRGIGLVDHFADLVFLVGHGSSSRNNPLRSAYDCGACGGRPGRINARAFSLMANNPAVRALVAERSGISIPDSTWFLGAFHNTCSDQIEYFDLDRCPPRLAGALNRVREDLHLATQQNALERCRRFVQSGVTDVRQAELEALARSFMLAEARPEYGHATNAICIVGPRALTSGLFLDRRSFLVSYDSSIDTEASILLATLRAVVPVCGGINLEYLFSAMDNEIYGAGTKLPHNIVSMVGIMNGTSSDLRTGLPMQMVEIHEPVRLLLVVACRREQLEKVIETDASIENVFRGGWIKLVLWNRDTGQLEWRAADGSYSLFSPVKGALTQIHDYRDWFLGKSTHLGFAELESRQGRV